jgi:hypothetical protein
MKPFFHEKTFRQGFMKFHGFVKFGFDRVLPPAVHAPAKFFFMLGVVNSKTKQLCELSFNK